MAEVREKSPSKGTYFSITNLIHIHISNPLTHFGGAVEVRKALRTVELPAGNHAGILTEIHPLL